MVSYVPVKEMNVNDVYIHSFSYITFHLAFIYRKQKTQLNNCSTPCCWQVHILLFSFVLTAFHLLHCSLAVQSKFGRHFTRSLYATSVVCKYTIGLTLLQYPYVHSLNSSLWWGGGGWGGSNVCEGNLQAQNLLQVFVSKSDWL